MHSEKLDQIVPALIAAQKQFRPVERDATNPFFNSKYATLETVIEATRDALRDNGLIVVQTFDITDTNGTALETTLYHVSGQYVSGAQVLKPTKEDPQGYKAASTYARRSAWLAILGIAEEDDDGNAASRPATATAGNANVSRFPAARPREVPPPLPEIDESSIPFESMPLPDAGGTQFEGVPGEVEFEVNIGKPFHKTGVTAKGPWELWNVRVDTDQSASTFDKKCGAFLDAHINRVCVLSCNKDAKGYRITGWRLA